MDANRQNNTDIADALGQKKTTDRIIRCHCRRYRHVADNTTNRRLADFQGRR
jgi:hypothetical protein